MSRDLSRRGAFEQASTHTSATKHRSIAFVELITTAALALSTAVAVTAVSIGIARAEVVGTVTTGDSASLAIALIVGLLLSAVSLTFSTRAKKRGISIAGPQRSSLQGWRRRLNDLPGGGDPWSRLRRQFELELLYQELLIGVEFCVAAEDQ